MKIVLIGFMCSGKSSVGRLLALKLGWTFFDTDDMIQTQVKAKIADIIRSQGEPAFRELEKKAVQLVAISDRSVIATGGGVPLDPDNMKELSRNGQVIWLKASPETVLKRAGHIKTRPLIDPHDPLASIQKRLLEREAAYAQASIAINTDSLGPADIVEEILKHVPLEAL